MINITDYGAVGDGVTKCTAAFAAAIDTAKSAGEQVYVPAGTFLTGTIDLKGVSLHLGHGAIIKGSSDIKDYPEQDFVHNELGVLRCLIFSLEGEGLVIDGHGTIDLNGKSFFDSTSPIIPESRVPFTDEQIKECTWNREDRPTLSIFFNEMSDITIKDVTLLDAPCWCLTFANCDNVQLSGLTIKSDFNVPNGDGIHICSCRHVRISDCDIATGDDCIAISGITSWDIPCEDIVINNCILETKSKAIALGYIYSHVKSVLIQNIIIKNSNRGLCFMANPGVGLVENVRIQNLIIDTRIAAGNWWGNGEPIFFMAMQHDGHIPADQKPERQVDVNFRNIHISGVICTAENAIALVNDGGRYENVTLRDIDFEMKESANLMLKGRTADVSPSREVVEIPASCALYVKNTADIDIRDFRSRDLAVVVE